MVGALAYTFSTLGMNIWAQIGRGLAQLVPLIVSRHLGYLRLLATLIRADYGKLEIMGLLPVHGELCRNREGDRVLEIRHYSVYTGYYEFGKTAHS